LKKYKILNINGAVLDKNQLENYLQKIASDHILTNRSDKNTYPIPRVKENYEFKQTAEETTINTVPATRIIDMYKGYILPFTISGILVLVYMVIRYYKKGILKVLARTVAIPVFGELFLLSVIVIARIPVGRFTPILVIGMYIAAILIVIKENEK